MAVPIETGRRERFKTYAGKGEAGPGHHASMTSISTGHRSSILRRESSLREMLDDPLLHSVMRCDGVPMSDLMKLIAEAQQRLKP
jgi:hypothetical protein